MEQVVGNAVVLFHLFPDGLGQLFDFLGLLDDLDRQDVLVGLVHVLLELGGKFEELVGVALDAFRAVLVHGLHALVVALHFFDGAVHAEMRIPFGGIGSLGADHGRKEDDGEQKKERINSHGNLEAFLSFDF